jgi:hypothetical protein
MGSSLFKEAHLLSLIDQRKAIIDHGDIPSNGPRSIKERVLRVRQSSASAAEQHFPAPAALEEFSAASLRNKSIPAPRKPSIPLALKSSGPGRRGHVVTRRQIQRPVIGIGKLNTRSTTGPKPRVRLSATRCSAW